jgi:hypothetical protein
MFKYNMMFITYCCIQGGDNANHEVCNKLTVKRTDPTIVARATTYSGKVARIVQVVRELAGAVEAAH